MDDFSPSTQGWIIAFGSAAVLWLVSKAKIGTTFLAYHLATWLASRELRKAKRARVDTFAIQREISKESSLFSCFVLSSLLGIGFFLSVAGTAPLASQMLMVTLLMVPVLVIEIWWLVHRDYVETLIKEAAKLSPAFTRRIPIPRQSARRINAREARRKKIADKKVIYRKPGPR